MTPREEGFAAAKQIQAQAAIQKKPVHELEDYVYPEVVLFNLENHKDLHTEEERAYWEGYLSAWD